jgi:hypothetical protein
MQIRMYKTMVNNRNPKMSYITSETDVNNYLVDINQMK